MLNQDESFDNGFTPGWYISMIQEALSEIAFDTFFHQEFCDYYNWNESDTFQIAVPAGAFSIKSIFVFNGDVYGAIESSAKVNFKKEFNNLGHSSGYTAKIKDTGAGVDAEREMGRVVSVPADTVYANIFNGKIIFSDSCDGWENVRIIYYGVPYDIGEVPVVPIYLKKYVIDYVLERYWLAKKADDPRMRINWSDALFNLEGGAREGIRKIGSKKEAERRIKSLSRFERDSMREYWARAQHLGY